MQLKTTLSGEHIYTVQGQFNCSFFTKILVLDEDVKENHNSEKFLKSWLECMIFFIPALCTKKLHFFTQKLSFGCIIKTQNF
jgi:hypothetical protein